MPDTTFDELETEVAAQGVEAAVSRLAEHVRNAASYHELFDVRLMEARHRLGLPVILTQSLDDLDEPLRTRMEDAYLAACREVGGLLLHSGRVREAWMYLRPAGDKAEVAAALEKLAVDDHNREQIIEVALYEGVCPRLGFELVLAHYGTCNAISMFDAQMHHRSRAQRQEVAGLLVRHLHQELLRGLRAEISKKEGFEPPDNSIQAVLEGRTWLFDNDDYHIDTSHLSAVVRFALWIDRPDQLRLAVDLAEYGRRLSRQFQFPGQEPFVDMYPGHALFFRALLGEGVEEAVSYFRERASALAGTESASGAAEVLVSLLARLGRHSEAFEACATLLPPDARPSGFAPSLLELARLSGSYGRLREVSRERGDLVGFTMGLVEEKLRADGA